MENELAVYQGDKHILFGEQQVQYAEDTFLKKKNITTNIWPILPLLLLQFSICPSTVLQTATSQAIILPVALLIAVCMKEKH